MCLDEQAGGVVTGTSTAYATRLRPLDCETGIAPRRAQRDIDVATPTKEGTSRGGTEALRPKARHGAHRATALDVSGRRP
jgi:hypothetical protein